MFWKFKVWRLNVWKCGSPVQSQTQSPPRLKWWKTEKNYQAKFKVLTAGKHLNAQTVCSLQETIKHICKFKVIKILKSSSILFLCEWTEWQNVNCNIPSVTKCYTTAEISTVRHTYYSFKSSVQFSNKEWIFIDWLRVSQMITRDHIQRTPAYSQFHIRAPVFAGDDALNPITSYAGILGWS